jgi:hypothetical protein
MQFDDGAIDAGGQSKVVGVDYEAGHEAKSINSVLNLQNLDYGAPSGLAKSAGII